MKSFITARQPQISELCRTHHVKRLSIFGSAARDDFDAERSDIDLLVEFEQHGIANRFELYFDLHALLEKLFHRQVDLIEAGSIRNAYMQQAVDEDLRTLYAA